MARPFCGRRRAFALAALAFALMHGEAHAATRPLADVKFDSPKHQVVVRVRLGGQGPFAMLLDTGTDPSAIDLALAKRLRPPADTTLHEGDGEGVEPILAFAWDMVDLEVGKLRADTVEAAAIDLTKISEKLGMRVDGVLGYSFLRGRIVQIDYRRGRLRFYDTSPPLSRPESVELEMTLDPADPMPRFAGRINRRNVLLLYDSGSSHSIAVVGRSIERLGLKAAFDAARPDSAFGYGGRAETRMGILPAVVIGAFGFHDVPCVFGVRGYGESWDPGTEAGKIGGALLEGMVVTLDYPQRRIRFEK